MHENVEVLNSLSEKEFGELFNAHSVWADKLGKEGYLISGDGLDDSGVVIEGKNQSVKKEPFVNQGNMIGGYYLLKADSIDAIVEIAKSCPCHLWGGTTEIRPIMIYDQE